MQIDYSVLLDFNAFNDFDNDKEVNIDIYLGHDFDEDRLNNFDGTDFSVTCSSITSEGLDFLKVNS